MSTFDLLTACYKELAVALKDIDDPTVQNILESWDISFNEIDDILSLKQFPKSKMISGLRQGLDDLPELINDIPEPNRTIASEKCHFILRKYFSDESN